MNIKLNKLIKSKDNNKLNLLSNPFHFMELGKLEYKFIRESYEFAYNMSFTSDGHHRKNRSGGSEKRKNVQIFCDAFNGKLGEFAVYQYFQKNKINIPYPDLSLMGKGKWDSCDFYLEKIQKNISIKTTKRVGNLLLLETKDWNDKGEYIPNIGTGNMKYDDFLLTRVDSDIISNLKKEKLYYLDEIEINKLESLLKMSSYDFDIAGVVSIEMLRKAIKERNIIKKDDFLQTLNTKLDAENYYIQSGDMYEINSYIKYLSML